MEEDKKEEIEIVKVTEELIKAKTYEVRGYKVMLDFDLAKIYGYSTKAFNQQVKNNSERFASDFAFKLTKEEVLWSSFFVTLRPNFHYRSYTLP